MARTYDQLAAAYDGGNKTTKKTLRALFDSFSSRVGRGLIVGDSRSDVAGSGIYWEHAFQWALNSRYSACTETPWKIVAANVGSGSAYAGFLGSLGKNAILTEHDGSRVTYDMLPPRWGGTDDALFAADGIGLHRLYTGAAAQGFGMFIAPRNESRDLFTPGRGKWYNRVLFPIDANGFYAKMMFISQPVAGAPLPGTNISWRWMPYDLPYLDYNQATFQTGTISTPELATDPAGTPRVYTTAVALTWNSKTRGLFNGKTDANAVADGSLLAAVKLVYAGTSQSGVCCENFSAGQYKAESFATAHANAGAVTRAMVAHGSPAQFDFIWIAIDINNVGVPDTADSFKPKMRALINFLRGSTMLGNGSIPVILEHRHGCPQNSSPTDFNQYAGAMAELVDEGSAQLLINTRVALERLMDPVSQDFTGLTDRGTWSAAFGTYAVGDYVNSAAPWTNLFHRCILGHASNTANSEPGLSESRKYWAPLLFFGEGDPTHPSPLGAELCAHTAVEILYGYVNSPADRSPPAIF